MNIKTNFNSGSHLKNYIVKVIKDKTGWMCNGSNLISTCDLVYKDEDKVYRLVKWAINSEYNIVDVSDAVKRKRLNRQLKIARGDYS